MWCGKKKRALCQGEKLVEIQTRKDEGWWLLEKIRTFCVSWLFLCFAQSSSQSPKMSTIIERVQNWLFFCKPFLAGLDLYRQLLLATFFQQVYPRNRKPLHRKRRFSEVLRKNWLLCSKSVLESNYWSQLKHKSAKHTHQCTAFHMSKQPGQCEKLKRLVEKPYNMKSNWCECFANFLMKLHREQKRLSLKHIHVWGLVLYYVLVFGTTNRRQAIQR